MGEDYTAKRRKEIFSEFGQVEDVVIKDGSALIVMSTKDAAVSFLICIGSFLPYSSL